MFVHFQLHAISFLANWGILIYEIVQCSCQAPTISTFCVNEPGGIMLHPGHNSMQLLVATYCNLELNLQYWTLSPLYHCLFHQAQL